MSREWKQFANPTPPKPKEPTGLGAVVEDAEGKQWLLVAPGLGLHCWAQQDEVVGKWWQYDEIDAVKVLSEGWA